MLEFSIDPIEIEVVCPVCNFVVPVTLRQARVRDLVICRGCKGNIQLEDHMNQVKKAERDIRRAMGDLSETLEGFGMLTLEI